MTGAITHLVSFGLAGLWVCCSGLAADGVAVKIEVDPQTIISHISPDFLGFGYETSAVAQPDFFSVKNSQMVNLYRNLSSHGLIRIGGIISDHTRYEASGNAIAHAQNDVTIINKKSLEDLADFTKATGWRVMWGLNLGTASKQMAVQEAIDVDASLGSQLQSFEIGNEVDALARFKNDFAAYHTAYLEYKTAIRAKLPLAAFSGPDGSGPLDWVNQFAQTESADLKLLTVHYYIGSAADPGTTIEKMLKPDQDLADRLADLQTLSKAKHVAFRINETNSFCDGGKAEVSDTFASALWCLDYLYQLASHGCGGVNMETDINQHGWVSHYSPIVHDAKGHWNARPEYYGLLAFSLAGEGDLLKVLLAKSGLNLTAYATRDDSRACWITVINQEKSKDAAVQVELPPGYFTIDVFRLAAPSIASKDGVTFSSTHVAADGGWVCGDAERLKANTVTVPHASAVVLRLDH